MDDRIKNLRGTNRRDFIRWSVAVAAALGLERSRYLNVLGDTAGLAFADTVACTTTTRSIHLISGVGGFANFQLIFPHNAVAASGNGNFAFHAPGSARKATTTDRDLYYAPQSPFQQLAGSKQITAIMAGTAQIHTSSPTSAAGLGNGVAMMAAIASVQQATPTLLPVIAVDGTNSSAVFGAAPGAPALATAPTAGGIVELFNSAASRTLLNDGRNASLHETYYKAFLALNAAAGRSGVAKGLDTGKLAAGLLARNLATELMPTETELAMYGITAGSRSAFREIASGIIVGLKAFKLGLTSMLVMPALTGDDPHGMFNNGNGAAVAAATGLGRILDGMMSHAASLPDPSCASKSLADNIVMTIHGDTPKTPLVRAAWPDGTPGNSNWIYILGNGYLKTGWFGGINTNGAVTSFDPATGNNMAPPDGNNASASTSSAGAAAALYAVTKGDQRRVQDFFRGNISGLVKPVQL